MDKPRTKQAMKTWLMMQELKKAGYQVPGRTARCVPRPRLWIRYTVAIDLLAQAIGVDVMTAAKSVEYRVARFDHGYSRTELDLKAFRHRRLREGKEVVVCPVCASRLDLDSGQWEGDEEALDLRPMDDPQANPQ